MYGGSDVVDAGLDIFCCEVVLFQLFVYEQDAEEELVDTILDRKSVV